MAGDTISGIDDTQLRSVLVKPKAVTVEQPDAVESEKLQGNRAKGLNDKQSLEANKIQGQALAPKESPIADPSEPKDPNAIDAKKSDDAWGKSGASKIGDSFKLGGQGLPAGGMTGTVTGVHSMEEVAKGFTMPKTVEGLEKALSDINGSAATKDFLRQALKAGTDLDDKAVEGYVDRKAGNEAGSAGMLMNGKGAEINSDAKGKYVQIGYGGEAGARKYAKAYLSDLTGEGKKVAVPSDIAGAETTKPLAEKITEAEIKANKEILENLNKKLPEKVRQLADSSIEELATLQNGDSYKKDGVIVAKVAGDYYYDSNANNLAGSLTDLKPNFMLSKDAEGKYSSAEKVEPLFFGSGKEKAVYGFVANLPDLANKKVFNYDTNSDSYKRASSFREGEKIRLYHLNDNTGMKSHYFLISEDGSMKKYDLEE